MQIGKKCIENLFVNIMLKKNVLKNMDLQKKKHLFMPLYLGMDSMKLY
jgi:hypothetical protein